MEIEKSSGRVPPAPGHSGSAPNPSVSAKGECPSRGAKADTLTEPRQAALCKLIEHGGQGAIDKHGKLVASGVRLMGFDAVTWLRLLTTGHVAVLGPLRIGITAKGTAAAAPAVVKVNPHGIQSNRYQQPARLPGAE